MKLSEYFDRQIHFDRRDLREVEEAIDDCVALFSKAAENETMFKVGKGWHYAYPSNDPIRSSISTTAMIGASLQRLLGLSPAYRAAEGYSERPLFKPYKIDQESAAALKKIVDNTNITIAKLVEESEKKHSSAVFSKTYGADDPASLGWCWDLVGMTEALKPQDKDRINGVKSALRRAIVRIAEDIIKTQTEGQSRTLERIIVPGANSEVGGSTFLALRLVRLVRAFEVAGGLAQSEQESIRSLKDKLTSHFEGHLHRHLSFGEIPDSRFDAAELAFCLEGLLQCEKWRVDRRIMGRAIDVLRKNQEASAFWRSETPIVARGNGLVLLPVSVEAANSLLAAINLFDGDKKLHEPVGADCIRMLSRFWLWLKSRRVELQDASDRSMKLFGWHSEHVNDRDIIHLWETSQVLEFLLSFRHFLKHHIARTSLELSGVKNVWFKPSDDVYSRDSSGEREMEADISVWKRLHWEKFEPWSFVAEGVYANIWKDFVEPRIVRPTGAAQGKCRFNPSGGKFFSMLLYGPPGTGKTTVAENLAKVFDCRLISLSVSDFMEAGAAQMEARAKQIFEMLEHQPFSVVLFDEFDPFMYDRDGDRFDGLSPEFQLMTNGMLPKLQDLKKSESVLFVFATNYLDRIDSAIKRTGRFDRRYLLPLLDWTGRARAIGEFVAKGVKAGIPDTVSDAKRIKQDWVSCFKDGAKRQRDKVAAAWFQGRLLPPSGGAMSGDILMLKDGTALFGYTDLKLAFDVALGRVNVSIKDSDGPVTERKLQEKLKIGIDAALKAIDDLSPSANMEQVRLRLFPLRRKNCVPFEDLANQDATTPSFRNHDFNQDAVDEYLSLVVVKWEAIAKAGSESDSTCPSDELQYIRVCLTRCLEPQQTKARKALNAVLKSIGAKEVADGSTVDSTLDSLKGAIESKLQLKKTPRLSRTKSTRRNRPKRRG